MQLLVVKDADDGIAREGGHTKALLSTEKKPSMMEDDEWNDIDFRAKVTIILCHQMRSSIT